MKQTEEKNENIVRSFLLSRNSPLTTIKNKEINSLIIFQPSKEITENIIDIVIPLNNIMQIIKMADIVMNEKMVVNLLRKMDKNDTKEIKLLIKNIKHKINYAKKIRLDVFFEPEDKDAYPKLVIDILYDKISPREMLTVFWKFLRNYFPKTLVSKVILTKTPL